MTAVPVSSGLVGLRIAVADLAAAERLYELALGATPLPAAEVGTRRWQLAPGLVVEARRVHGEVGPLAAVVVVEDVEAVADAAAQLGIETHAHPDRLTVTDTRVASGQLEFVAPDTGSHAAATPASEAASPVCSARVEGFDHACFAVTDLERTTRLLMAAGGRPVLGGDTWAGTRMVQVAFDRLMLELALPVAPGPVQAFLDRRAGHAAIQHVTLKVSDVPAAVDALDALGLATVGTNTTRQPGWHETYLHPHVTDRLLIQLVRSSHQASATLDEAQLRDVFAGRFVAHDYTMHPREEVTR